MAEARRRVDFTAAVLSREHEDYLIALKEFAFVYFQIQDVVRPEDLLARFEDPTNCQMLEDLFDRLEITREVAQETFVRQAGPHDAFDVPPADGAPKSSKPHDYAAYTTNPVGAGVWMRDEKPRPRRATEVKPATAEIFDGAQLLPVELPPSQPFEDDILHLVRRDDSRSFFHDESDAPEPPLENPVPQTSPPRAPSPPRFVQGSSTVSTAPTTPAPRPRSLHPPSRPAVPGGPPGSGQLVPLSHAAFTFPVPGAETMNSGYASGSLTFQPLPPGSSLMGAIPGAGHRPSSSASTLGSALSGPVPRPSNAGASGGTGIFEGDRVVGYPPRG